MDDSSSSTLLILTVLLFLDVLLTLAYTALINTRQTQLRELAEEGNKRAQQVIDLLNSRSHLSVTYKFSTILLRFIVVAVLMISVVPAITGEAGLSPLALLVLLLAAIALLILSDLVPEGIGSAHATSIALWMVGPMRLLGAVFGPLTAAMLFVSRGLAQIFGGGELVNTVTEEEIMTLVNAGHTGGTIEDEEKAMIYSILQLDQTMAREVMTPRPDIVALNMNIRLEEALDTFIRSGFSRIPVYEENIDNISGLLYAKDLLDHWKNNDDDSLQSIRGLLRTAYFVPETKSADELLKEMQNRKVHMAIVVDEYGGTSGLVTIENLLEEIVGDIRDEYDHNEEYEYIQKGAEEYLIDASMDLDDINDLLDINIDTTDTDTLGGYILLTLGRVPLVDEIIETELLHMQIRSIDGRRIRKVHVVCKQDASETDAGSRDNQESPSTQEAFDAS